MIIWGTRGREIEVTTGQFNCPKCQTVRPYKHKRVARYFTLFFIPLFPIQKLGDFIECQACRQTYKLEVLNYKPPSPAEKLMFAVRQDLENGPPLHMVQQKLIANGVDPQIAKKMIDSATSGKQVKCSQCGFAYLETIHLCANCGSRLTPP